MCKLACSLVILYEVFDFIAATNKLQLLALLLLLLKLANNCPSLHCTLHVHCNVYANLTIYKCRYVHPHTSRCAFCSSHLALSIGMGIETIIEKRLVFLKIKRKKRINTSTMYIHIQAHIYIYIYMYINIYIHV